MGPPKILIIDDDIQVHKMLATVLSIKNYTIESLMDARTALDKMRIFKPDLIVLDIMMPEISGIELCQKIKADPELASTCVLMLSAKDSQHDRLKGLQYGADDYVTKPFHVSTLVRKIEHILEKKK